MRVFWTLEHNPNVFVCFRETSEDADSLGDASSQPDTVSIASRTSQNTADSDKVTHTHTQSHAHSQTRCERVCRAVVWPHCCCSWLGVCFWCAWGSFHYSWSDSFKKLSLLCSPDEVRFIYFTRFSLVGPVAVTSDLGNSDPAGLCSDLWDS